VRKPEEKKSLEKRRCKWEDNIKMTHKETGQEGVDWRHTVLERVRQWSSCTRQWIFRFHHKRKISWI